MTRAYIRLDPGFDDRKYDYPDVAYAALVASFCLAELQPERGRFRSVDYLKRLLGKRGKAVAYLTEHGDLTVLPDGRVYVDGWDEWQEGDWKVTERVHRIRSRRNGRCNGPANGPVTADVTVGRLDSGAVRSVAERSGATDRADIDAFLLVRRRLPTLRQRKLMDDYLVLFDETGPERAARIILSHPDDPIGGLMADLEAYRKERLGVASQEEAEAKKRRQEQRQRNLSATQRELMNEWARQQKLAPDASAEPPGAAA